MLTQILGMHWIYQERPLPIFLFEIVTHRNCCRKVERDNLRLGLGWLTYCRPGPSLEYVVADWLAVIFGACVCDCSTLLRLSGLSPEYSQAIFRSTQFEHGWARSHRRFFSRQAWQDNGGRFHLCTWVIGFPWASLFIISKNSIEGLMNEQGNRCWFHKAAEARGSRLIYNNGKRINKPT